MCFSHPAAADRENVPHPDTNVAIIIGNVSIYGSTDTNLSGIGDTV